MNNIRKIKLTGVLFVIGIALSSVMLISITASAKTQITSENVKNLPYTPVVTPNGSSLPWKIVDGVKEYHLSIDVIEHEIAPGMVIQAWGYNGETPGPTIEAVEGDKVKFIVTNNLPENTAIHWHGIFLPSGMDGVNGLTQPPIKPGDVFVYEFQINQHGSFMYHSHGDEMVQMGMGSMGMLIVHPKKPKHKIDRDFAIMLNEWYIEPGTYTPDTNVMTDFNIFTFNSHSYPGTEPLVIKKGDRVRIRWGNVAQDLHPIHIHGLNFNIVATDGGQIPESAQWPETSVVIAPGQTRDIEFIADAPGDWAMHCHRRHHPMNAMGHEIPVMLGVNQDGVEEKIRDLLPGYMAMGEDGMDEMTEMGDFMAGPKNTLPMMSNVGPFGGVGMGGMFTVLKIREGIKTYDDPDWYDHPKGTVSYKVGEVEEKKFKPRNMIIKMNTSKGSQMEHKGSMMDHKGSMKGSKMDHKGSMHEHKGSH